MKVVYSRLFPFHGFYAMNFFGLCVIRKEYKDYAKMYPWFHSKAIRHESIHTEQMKETLYIGFYILYLIAFLIRLLTPPMKTAYKDISFEQEAFGHEEETDYLEKRKAYAWMGYIFKSSKR